MPERNVAFEPDRASQAAEIPPAFFVGEEDSGFLERLRVLLEPTRRIVVVPTLQEARRHRSFPACNLVLVEIEVPQSEGGDLNTVLPTLRDGKRDREIVIVSDNDAWF